MTDVYRLRDEIAMLTDIQELNQRMLTTYWPPEKERQHDEELRLYLAAVDFGISEWDAEHPCKAIEQREAEMRRLAPALVLREMDAPTLPGFS